MRTILIMVDTLRYDYLGFTGQKMAETKALDELAEQSCFFDNAYIGSFPTVPNREDVNRGLYTFPHHGWGALPEEATPIAQVMADNGHITQLITDTPHLLGTGHRYHRGFQGYYWVRGNECDTFFTRYNIPFRNLMPFEKTRTDSLLFGKHPLVEWADWIVETEMNWEEEYFVARTASTASKWIEQNYKAEDFFLWIDTFECHEPWRPPQYLSDRYDPKYKGYRVSYPVYGHADCYTKEELQNMRANYAGEVTLTSKWIGHIIQKLKDTGIFEDTMIIVKSDHGNYMGEHNRAGKMLVEGTPRKIERPWPHYQEVTHIPLMIKMPGQKKGKRIKELVQPVDIFPTILDCAGIKTDLPTDGLSLKPLMNGSKCKWPRKYAFSAPMLRTADELPEYWTTITGQGWTLMLGGEEDKKMLLYNIESDPRQQKDVLERNLDVVKEMGEAYLAFLHEVKTDSEKIALIEARLNKTISAKSGGGIKKIKVASKAAPQSA